MFGMFGVGAIELLLIGFFCLGLPALALLVTLLFVTRRKE